jgi:hypothetical protein
LRFLFRFERSFRLAHSARHHARDTWRRRREQNECRDCQTS